MAQARCFSPLSWIVRSFIFMGAFASLLAWGGSAGVAGAAGQNEITVAGYPYSGESFVFVIDRSWSMGWSGDIDVAKATVIEALGELDASMSFSLVSFASQTSVFNSSTIPATSAGVSAGVDWVNALDADGTTCMLDGLVAGLDILVASGATATTGSIFLFADGEPNCPGYFETLEGALLSNTLGIPIHSFLPPGAESDLAAAQFLLTLSDQNNGSFVDMALPVVPPSEPFLRGDANGDASVTLADAVSILLVGFGISTNPICELAADVNADQQFVPVAEAVYLLNALFVPLAPPIPAPQSACGSVHPDPLLDCAVNPVLEIAARGESFRIERSSRALVRVSLAPRERPR